MWTFAEEQGRFAWIQPADSTQTLPPADVALNSSAPDTTGGSSDVITTTRVPAVGPDDFVYQPPTAPPPAAPFIERKAAWWTTAEPNVGPDDGPGVQIETTWFDHSLFGFREKVPSILDDAGLGGHGFFLF
jgi:hypothetical protein